MPVGNGDRVIVQHVTIRNTATHVPNKTRIVSSLRVNCSSSASCTVVSFVF